MALQMTWQPNRNRRTNAPPIGLRNLGNSCYLNSVLQCLTYTPPLANFCLKSQHSSLCCGDSAAAAEPNKKKSECPFCILEKRITRSLHIDQALDAPYKINSNLRIFADHFCPGRQEDAHEFLRYVIDACHNTCLRLKKLQLQRRKPVINGGRKAIRNGCGDEGFGDDSVVKEIFGGSLQSQVKCLSCGAESNKVDEIMDLSLDVVHSSSLKEALHKFFQSEVLDGNNKYKCDHCKKLVPARKQMSIVQAPNVLVVQLKRFESIYGGKIDKAIAFEEVLVLSSYMCNASQDPHPEYNLFATIVHSGFSPDSGHYYAYIKDAMSRWYCCNDSFVSLSTLQDVLSEKVYILFFSRSKQRPVMVNTASGTNGIIKSNGGCNGDDTSKISVNNTRRFDNCSLSKDKITSSSKVGQVPSSSQMKLTSVGDSGTKQFPEPVNNVKLIFHKKGSYEKNGDVKASIFTDKSENNSKLLKDMNGVAKRSEVAPDGERSHSVFLANGKDKIQRISINGITNRMSTGSGPSQQVLQNGSIKEEDTCTSFAEDSRSRRKYEELSADGITNGMSAVSGRRHQVLQNGSVKEEDSCTSEESNADGITKRMSAGSRPIHQVSQNGSIKEEDSCTSFAEDYRSHIKSGELNSKRKVREMDLCDSFTEDGEPNLKLEESSSKRKLQAEDSCSLFAESAQSRAKLEELSSKRKLPGKNTRSLFAEDDQRSGELNELKESLEKETALVLRSCGWYDDVHHFLRKKRFCARVADNDSSNRNDMKTSLIADAKNTFLSQIPQSLKGNLIGRLRSFIEKECFGP